MTALLILTLAVGTLQAQVPDPMEGLWQGYDGEWGHVSRQLIALADAIPAEKYAWRPGPGVRSTGEVFMHIAGVNFYLLGETGQKLPPEFDAVHAEKIPGDKARVVEWLKRSLDAVKQAHAGIKPADLTKEGSN
jgi:DinB superfamily